MNFADTYKQDLAKVIDGIDAGKVQQAIDMFLEARGADQTVFVFGNGGSASTASHFACDMVKGASFNRNARFKIMALTDSLPTITAYSNDVAYDAIFLEQLKNFAKPGDLVMVKGSNGSRAGVVATALGALDVGSEGTR